MRKLLVSVLSLMAFMLVLSTESRADGTAVAGLLTCKKTGDGMTYFLFSKHPVTCTYDGVGGPQTYQGISGIGLGVDLDFDKEAAMGYMVLGGSSTNKNSLSGTYVGGKAQATVGLGLGAQGGLAGAGNGFVLVPLGLGGQAMGFGAAAGISYLQLQ